MHPNFKEFTVSDHIYRCGKMNVKQQFHVSRRVLPVFVGLARGSEGKNIMEQFGGLADALSGLKDEDADYVISHSLSVVQRKLPGEGGWGNVWSSAGDRPMFDDISLAEMLQIVVEVLGHNLGNFMQELPSGLSDIVQKT